MTLKFNSQTNSWVLRGQDLPIQRIFPVQEGGDKEQVVRKVLAYIKECRPGFLWLRVTDTCYRTQRRLSVPIEDRPYLDDASIDEDWSEVFNG